ncbi:MAG: PD-(D/E)XK nuclease family protein [Acidimicrobiales bacterium]
MATIGVTWVRYGREAGDALRAAVGQAKAGEPLRPVTVVIPSNHVGVASRRLLASGSLGPVCERGVGLAAVTFLTIYRLAELLGATRLAGTGRRPVSTPVIAAAVRSALVEQPGLFSPVATHPATESALVEAYRELRDCSPAALDALRRTGPRAGEVVRLQRATRARLQPSWYDEEDLMVAAAEALRHGDPVASAIGTLIVYLPQRLSRHGAALLVTAAEHTPVTAVAGVTGEPRADAEVVDSVARLGATDEPPADVDPVRVVSLDRTRFVPASDADDEVRAAVRAVLDAARDGVPLDRIAILHAGDEPYARLAHEHLSSAGIAVNGAAVTSVASRVAGRALLRLLDLPDGDFRREDLFAWLAAAPVLDEGRWVPTLGWERASREAGVVAGRSQWDELLARRADDRDARADRLEADADEGPWRAAQARREAEQARSLRTFVLRLVDEIGLAADQSCSWAERAQWARALLRRVLGGAGRRGGWPEVEAKAAERVEHAIDRLAALDGVEGPASLEVFTRTLELELESDLGRVGRFGDGVLVGSVAMGVGPDLDLVVVVGQVEGSLPATVRDDSLLPDHERAATGQLALRRQRVDRDQRQLLAALAGARRHLLCLPRGDLRRSSQRVPSRWALAVASRLAGDRWWSADLLARTVPWVDHVASFDAGLRRVAFPATAQEHRLKSLLIAAGDGPPVAALRSPADPVLAAGANVVAARRSDRFTRFDGNLAGLDLPSPVDRATSATALQRWAGCPFTYLLQDVLRVVPVENPEDELQITPLDRGSLVHEALEQFMVGVLARPADQRPGPDESWDASDHGRMDDILDRIFADYEARGLTGRPIFWRREQVILRADLHHVLGLDSRHRKAHRTSPVAAELAFGFRGDGRSAAVPIRLPDGRSLCFRGQADRIDEAEDGTLHIVDYKTGRSQDYTDLSEDEPDLRGTRLQLPIYGEAARLHRALPSAPVWAEYWFVSTKGGFARLGHAVTPAVLERVGATLGAIVAGIEAGAFPHHPSASVTSSPWERCPSCDPDGLGVGELRRAWDRKRHDPALAGYATLAEPLVEEPVVAVVDE